MQKTSCVFHLQEFNDCVSFSSKGNTNVEGKSENERGIQDESQKCENLTNFLIQYTKTLF